MRFGIAGTGHWARTVHVPGLARAASATAVGVWGRSAEAARKLAEPNGLIAYHRFEQMLEAVDAVSFAVPPDVQADLAHSAARAGKHLLLEKPVALSSAAANEVAQAARTAGVVSIVFFTRRFVPELERYLIEAGRKRWHRASVIVHASVMSTDSPYSESAWRKATGAALWDTGPHALSILDPVLGQVTRILSAEIRNRTVRFSTLHAQGAIADVSLTLHGVPGQDVTRYVFTGPEGESILPDPDFDRPSVLARAADELALHATQRLQAHRCDAGFGARIVATLEAIERELKVAAREC